MLQRINLPAALDTKTDFGRGWRQYQRGACLDAVPSAFGNEIHQHAQPQQPVHAKNAIHDQNGSAMPAACRRRIAPSNLQIHTIAMRWQSSVPMPMARRPKSRAEPRERSSRAPLRRYPSQPRVATTPATAEAAIVTPATTSNRTTRVDTGQHPVDGRNGHGLHACGPFGFHTSKWRGACGQPRTPTPLPRVSGERGLRTTLRAKAPQHRAAFPYTFPLRVNGRGAGRGGRRLSVPLPPAPYVAPCWPMYSLSRLTFGNRPCLNRGGASARCGSRSLRPPQVKGSSR